MSPQAVITLIILAVTIVIFILDRLSWDVVALLVLAVLAIAGVVTPQEALSGFSNPAVVTVWAVFILSAGLMHTGVAGYLGRQILRIAGTGEVRLILVIMVVSAFLSAFMNNIGVAALFLPVVMDISRKTRQARSRLLMPLAFGCLLGGMTTLIGTPSNILASDALDTWGVEPLGFFDFLPVGGAVVFVGVGYMLVLGRRLLPKGRLDQTTDRYPGLGKVYDLKSRLFQLRIPAGSGLGGKPLAQSRLGVALGFDVLAILRDGQQIMAPDPDTQLLAGDTLLVEGHAEELEALYCWQGLELIAGDLTGKELVNGEVILEELRPIPGSSLLGQTLRSIDFRNRYGGLVVGLKRSGVIRRTNLQDIPLRPEDTLLVQANKGDLKRIRDSGEFEFTGDLSIDDYRLEDRMERLRIPEGSCLADQNLNDLRLGAAFGITVLGINRQLEWMMAPEPDTILSEGDILMVEMRLSDLEVLQGLLSLEIITDDLPDLRNLQTEEIGMVEAVLAPRSRMVGKNLRELHFREKYGLSVLSIWREDRPYHTHLGGVTLRMGDALLLHGRRDKLRLLSLERDIILLDDASQAQPRTEKAPLAAGIMAAVLVPVIFGWLPVAIAAVAGAAVMVATGCLKMEEAYRAIQWRAVFLIAGLLPLGIALDNSGAANQIAANVIGVLDQSPELLLAGVFLITAIASQIMPNPAVTVLMAPIALNTAVRFGYSPYSLMMVVAVGASATFLSPLGHPTNLLVMSPGGYRLRDYIRVGFPLMVLVLLVVIFILPIFWPL